MKPQDFIDLIAPAAQALQRQTGLFTSLTIAQAILETGWGQFIPVDKDTGQASNNLFGIKGTGPAGYVLCWTEEELPDGSRIRILSKFRAYNDFSECLQDRFEVLMQPRYDRVREASTPQAAAGFLFVCGYATDSGYPDKLIEIMAQFDLAQYDILPALPGPFPDVPGDHWAAPVLTRLKDAGIIVGDEGTGNFRGDQPLTRYEMAAALDALRNERG